MQMSSAEPASQGTDLTSEIVPSVWWVVTLSKKFWKTDVVSCDI